MQVLRLRAAAAIVICAGIGLFCTSVALAEADGKPPAVPPLVVGAPPPGPQAFVVTGVVRSSAQKGVGFHVATGPDGTFDTFVGDNPALLDKRLLARFYRPSTLATAKLRWVEPDLTPFPVPSK